MARRRPGSALPRARCLLCQLYSLGLTDGREESRLLCMGMLPFVAYAAAAGVAGWLNPIPQPGEPGYAPEPANYLRLMFENDSPSGRDRNYTHGSRTDYARLMSNGDAWGLSLTQNIYTPENHWFSALPGEHPYCGYLALGGAYLWRGSEFGMGAEFQVGTTGKPSCAGNFQNTLHKMAAMPSWDGWHDQVPSEVTLQLTLRQEWAIPGLQTRLPDDWQMDARAVLRESAGTVRMGGGGGMALRVGRNLPPTQQSVGNSPTGFALGLIRQPGYDPAATSYFLALEMYMDYVARDISVDGGVFHHFDRTCARTPWQGEIRAGVGVSHEGIDYYAGMLLQTRTYKTQDENSLLGTFSISWHW